MHIPVTIVDNFFENPDAVRELGLSQKYYETDGRWPGVRSDLLHKTNEEFFHFFCRKVLRLFYPADDINYNCSASFQKVHQNLGTGWIHKDLNVITAIVYLNPDDRLDSGTSIYRLKKEFFAPDLSNNIVKKDFFLGKCDSNFAATYREKNNSQFEETIRISNVYNRLIVFDSLVWHGAQNFSSGDSQEERLTLIGFFDKIDPLGPVRRSKLEI